MAKMNATITLDVRGSAELISALRREMAAILCDVAEAESDPRVSRRLREVAAAFECGQGAV